MSNDELDEVNEQLENEQNSPWTYAHQKYEDGDKNPLEMQYHLKEMDHKEKVKKEINKKADNLDYDKFDCLLAGLLTISFTYLLHPLLLTVWVAFAAKIIQDSREELSKDDNKWQKLDDFGFELPYYIAGTLVSVYFFTSLQAEYIIWSKAGTLATIGLEVMRVAGLG